MIKINSLCYTALQNEEFLGMEQKFVTFTPGLTNEAIAGSVTAFKNSVAKLTAHLETDGSETVKHTAMRLNKERMDAYHALRDVVKPIRKLDDAASIALGDTYCAFYDGRETLYSRNQDAATKAINAVITAFRTHTTEELTSMGVERYLAILEKKEAEYEAAAKVRGEELDSHIDGLTLQYRADCVKEFEILTEHARILAVRNNDAACEDFINQVNGELTLRKEKLKMRQNAAAKKREEEKTNSSKTESTAATAQVEATVTESTNTETIKAVA